MHLHLENTDSLVSMTLDPGLKQTISYEHSLIHKHVMTI